MSPLEYLKTEGAKHRFDEQAGGRITIKPRSRNFADREDFQDIALYAVENNGNGYIITGVGTDKEDDLTPYGWVMIKVH